MKKNEIVVKKNVTNKLTVEYNKPLGCMTDDEWKKEKKRSVYSMFVIGLIMFVFLVGGIGGATAILNGSLNFHWLTGKPMGEYKSINLHQSELRQDFQLRVNGTSTNLNVSVLYDDNDSIWHSLGVFHLEFQRMTIFDGKVPSDAYVLYYPPDDWYTSVASEKAGYDEVHVPITKQKVGTDPTFFKDKDFPYILYPYDEIEITTNKVIKIVETNETIYDFYVRVKETNKDFNVVDMKVEYT